MNVNSAISAVQLGSVAQPQPAATAINAEPQTQQATQESSVVKLSTRAIQLSQAESYNQEAGETASREAAEPAAVQRAESAANSNRRIDTYA
jgi:hypothetical protein